MLKAFRLVCCDVAASLAVIMSQGGLPIDPPLYFNAAGAEAFRTLELRDDDVVMASYPKCGTTWMHTILFSLLRMNEDGKFPAPVETLLGSGWQYYPDAVPVRRRDATPRQDGTTQSIEDLLEQPGPRLFTCHIKATVALLPLFPEGLSKKAFPRNLEPFSSMRTR